MHGCRGYLTPWRPAAAEGRPSPDPESQKRWSWEGGGVLRRGRGIGAPHKTERNKHAGVSAVMLLKKSKL